MRVSGLDDGVLLVEELLILNILLLLSNTSIDFKTWGQYDLDFSSLLNCFIEKKEKKSNGLNDPNPTIQDGQNGDICI